MNTESDYVEVPPEPVDAESVASPNPTPSPAFAANHAPARPAPQPLSPTDERTWAMLAHLSVLLNIFTAFLGGILGAAVALVIYLLYKDRSRYVRYQAFQAFIFQLICFGAIELLSGTLIGTIVSVTIALMPFVIGFFIAPLAVVLVMILALLFISAPLIGLVYSIIGAVQTSNGEDFRYWLVGDWALNLM